MNEEQHSRTRVEETTIEQHMTFGVNVIADSHYDAIEAAEKHVAKTNCPDLPDAATYRETIDSDGDEYWIAVALDSIVLEDE